MNSLTLSPKYKAFLRHFAQMEVLEGTTAAGKTTVGAYKFICKVMASPKQLHILAADDTGAAEKNIIQKDLGIADIFPETLVEYKGNGSAAYKMPHLLVHTTRGDKVVFIVGYRDKTRWKDALGGQYGCLYIDEINTANMDFVRESVMRADYTMATLNPDDPSLPVYEEYINRCRPVPGWADGTPTEILAELTEPEHEGWTHWFFTFDDNWGIPEEKKKQIIESVPAGTKLWKNKIKGLRGRATGLVFSNFDRKKHVVSKEWAKQFTEERIRKLPPSREKYAERFLYFSAACDTAYSQQSPDTIAMSFLGITNFGKCILLDERVYNNAELGTPLAPSDTVRNLLDFLERNRREWGFAKDVFIDSADQATITECIKHKRLFGSIYNFLPSWKKEKIIDRINVQLGWFAEGAGGPYFYVVDSCATYLHELEVYSWKEDKDNEPEDGNDHMINSVQYGWLPYETKIGARRKA